VIISGGVRNFLDGYFLMEKTNGPAFYGQASSFLSHARGEYDDLKRFIRSQIDGFQIARAFLRVPN